jgi:hypothetical protein
MNNITNKPVTPKDKYRRTNSKKLTLYSDYEKSTKEIRNAIDYLLDFENKFIMK